MAAAQPALEQLKQASLREQACLCKKLDAQVEFTRIRESTSPVDAASSAGEVLSRAEAAIQTSVEDTQAGFTIAPLRFILDQYSPIDPQLTLAALDDGRTRLGVALNGVFSHADTSSPGAAGISFCSYDEVGYRKTLDDLGRALSRACHLVATLPPPPLDFPPDEEAALKHETWRIARHLCGVPGARPVAPPEASENSCKAAWTFEDAAHRVIGAARNEEVRLDKSRAADEEERTRFRERLAAVSDERDELVQHRAPNFLPSDTSLAQALRRNAWARSRFVVGIDGRMDFFPWKEGFNPAPNPEEDPLPKSQLAAWQVNLAGSWGHQRTFIKLGLRLEQERSAPTDELPPLSPGLSFKLTYTLGALAGSLTDPAGELLPIEGKLPPHVLLGVEGAIAFVNKRTAVHPYLVDNANAALWLEFRFTEKLAVRTGFQLDAKTVTRAEDTTTTPPTPELSKLQYSVPAFVLTALQF
ncbi:hypothetical protein SAMN05443572_11421 [Myxococcus fulvus]|uniref:Uncharacterized protein n=1 Tax=Myxococcus fulvus TaxID=33 RepID=A0A511TAH5_MYXFU|nr:hypothetical protein [Myxococcus fulvus]GEN11171.1 hypothetical protein MFU01_62080 [Myxococcus fulvus]SEU39392.1 hypothetical protein SAMN05443572_11421 [Myxococcus fulvus]